MISRVMLRAGFLLTLILGTTVLLAEERPYILEFHLKYLAVYGRRELTLNYDFDGDGKLDILNVTTVSDRNERWLAIHFQRNGGYSESLDVIWPLDDRACALVMGDFLPGGGTEIGFIA